LLGWYFPDSMGGTEVYVEGLCRRLRTAGIEVRIAAPDSRHVASERYEHDGVPVFRYGITDTPTRDEAYHRVPVRGADLLYDWLASERPDVLHVHSFTTGVGLPEIREARRLGIRVIVTCHLPGFGYMCRTGELMQWGQYPCDGVVIPDKCASCNLTRLGMPQSLARVVGGVPVPVSTVLRHLPGRAGTALGMSASIVEYQQMETELFDLVERFVVLNETARRMLLSNGFRADKMVLNRLGVSHANARRKALPELVPTTAPVRFGCIGRIHPTKGLAELARAAVAVPRDVPFRLDIRGPVFDDAARDFVKELRAIVGGDPRVCFEPGVPAHEVLDVLANLDALICPSMWFENGPTVALEAMVVGTPVMASRVGNLAEIVEDGVSGRLIDAGDVTAWSHALAQTAIDPAGTIDCWRRAIPEVRTMDDVARDYVALYGAN
jgi:glycosyltransferase involved in cell wall biosynthesis